jgi:hypothetical protein
MPKKNGSATYDQLAILASSVGLVEKTDEGRQAFVAWLSTDQKAARKALFGRVAARRVAASGTRSITAAEAQAARSGEPTTYPASWRGRARGAAASVRAGVASGQQPAVVAPKYPPGWLPAAGQTQGKSGVVVVEVND